MAKPAPEHFPVLCVDKCAVLYDIRAGDDESGIFEALRINVGPAFDLHEGPVLCENEYCYGFLAARGCDGDYLTAA